MNRHPASDGSFVRCVDVTSLHPAMNRLTLFCVPPRLTTTQVFGHNVTFGGRMTFRGLLTMVQYHRTKNGRRRNDCYEWDA